MGFLPIDSLKAFKKHLGETRTSKIRYFQRGSYKRQPCAKNTENSVIREMQHIEYSNDTSAVNDILTGMARATEREDRPLRVKQLYSILQCLPIINTREVQLMTRLSTRHARRYVIAARLAMPYLLAVLDRRKRGGGSDGL